MNSVILTGRICNDLELRYTNNDKAVCEFTLATNRIGNENTDFITCVVFGGQAENLKKYQSKGSMIGVEGSYRVDRYQDKDGNNRYKHYVFTERVHFLERKSPDESGQNEQKPDFYCNNNDTNVAVKEQNEAIKTNPYEEFGQQIQITDADLPF